jgi:hypothetical protein
MLLPLLVSISVTSNLAVFWRFLTHRDVILFQLLLLHMYQNIPVINGYPKGKTDISRHRLLIRSTWMHPCVVGVLVAHICFSFSLFVSSRSLCYFCSTVWLHYLIYDFLFIPQFFLPFHIIFVHFSLFFFLLTFFFFHILS